MQGSYRTQVHEGMEVLDIDGEKIGMMGEQMGDYFNVDAGFLGTNEYYVHLAQSAGSSTRASS